MRTSFSLGLLATLLACTLQQQAWVPTGRRLQLPIPSSAKEALRDGVHDIVKCIRNEVKDKSQNIPAGMTVNVFAIAIEK